MLHSLADLRDSEYNGLYPEGDDSPLEYAAVIQSRISELETLLGCCAWGEYERRHLQRELREARVTYYELKILCT